MKTAEKVILLAFALFLLFQVCRKVDQSSDVQLPDSFTEEDAMNHVCCDSTHELCDGWCDCDGVGCDISKD